MQTELQIVCAVAKARCGVQYLSIINSIREELEHAIDKHSRELTAYFASGFASLRGFPSVACMADKLHFSVGYFGDLIKKETGQTAQQYIQNKIIDLAKQELLGSNLPVSEIASRLGFEYPQHFTRMFKKVTGKSPPEYRVMSLYG